MSWVIMLILSFLPSSRTVGLALGYDDTSSKRGKNVAGTVWYAEQFIYPNHWSPGSQPAATAIDESSSHSWVPALAERLITHLLCVAGMFGMLYMTSAWLV